MTISKNVQIDAIKEAALRAVNAMAMFRPTIAQERFFRDMMSDDVREAAVTGRNRGGKSVALAVWFASVALDVPVTMRDGTKLHMRPKRWSGEELLMWLVGYDWKHNGETIYRLLFRPGLFKIIKGANGRFRSYDPTIPEDKDRKHETKPSPPLITESMVDPDSWSWESRKDRQLQSVRLKKDGTRLVFYASTGEVAAGNPVHVIWIDEKIQSDEHYPEWQMRIVDYEGRIVWSSWPTLSPSGTFTDILDRAEQQREADIRRTISFQFRKGDNPYTENETLDYMLGTMSDEEADARGNGSSSMSRWSMYDNFTPHIHCAYRRNSDGDDMLARVLRANNGMPPSSWTRYLFLDPGNSHAAVVKVAIPPPYFGSFDEAGPDNSAFVVPYKEYDLRHKTAEEAAKIVAADSEGEMFEDITCDVNAYVTTPMGMAGTTIGNIYEAAFLKERLISQRRGSTFSMGGNDMIIRSSMMRGMMNIRSIRTRDPEADTIQYVEAPRLRIVVERCPLLVRQLTKCRREQLPNKQPGDKHSRNQVIDLCVALEYAAIKKDLIYVPGRSQKQDTLTLKSIATMFHAKYGGTPTSKDEVVFCGAGRPKL